ncbi:TetR/AcrR family transcriptional regulator [Mycobacterium sp. Aquia_216]|uniref:TetR/AcrR family transcriptional regulator n=1 Tax=Mycobacterium sp. Aquia_216 TaxID=2991729 RepID=UPI00227BC070|nr:TetR/AcrR family transcriptional regulator [Mycobacterium sp. Aquia_216]WAJ45063.1 TetR/AcrR family transcriptional regulator [Mycobacterium sp. Aquia_216]
MPKVTEEQWKAQEQRYLDAARRCFSRIGVAPASMDEIRSEAGVSAGAMYRYFPSKDALIHAAIETSLIEVGELTAKVGERDDIAGPNAYLLAVLETLQRFRHHTEGVDLFRLAVQGWAHAQTQPKTKAMVMAAFQAQRAAFADAVSRWTGRNDASAIAAAIGGAVIGYVVQSLFTDGGVDPRWYCQGIAGLN